MCDVTLQVSEGGKRRSLKEGNGGVTVQVPEAGKGWSLYVEKAGLTKDDAELFQGHLPSGVHKVSPSLRANANAFAKMQMHLRKSKSSVSVCLTPLPQPFARLGLILEINLI